jgi:hypothetical protein
MDVLREYLSPTRRILITFILIFVPQATILYIMRSNRCHSPEYTGIMSDLAAEGCVLGSIAIEVPIYAFMIYFMVVVFFKTGIPMTKDYRAEFVRVAAKQLERYLLRHGYIEPGWNQSGTSKKRRKEDWERKTDEHIRKNKYGDPESTTQRQR